MRLKYRDIEVEGKNKNEIEWLLQQVKKLASSSQNDVPNSVARVPSPTGGVPIKIPKEGERLRRTKEEIAIDKAREKRGMPPMKREEIVKRRMEMKASAANHQHDPSLRNIEIDLDDVLE